jgi:hypothetical protein
MALAVVAGDGTTSAQELAALLRRRARVLGIIALCGMTVLIAFTAPGILWWYWQLLVIYAVAWLAIAAGTLRAWSGRPQSLTELRTAELVFLTLAVGLVTWYVFDRAVGHKDVTIMNVIGSKGAYVGRPNPTNPTQFEWWEPGLGDYAMHFAAAHYNFFWFAIIFGYALFIPNPFWRSLVIISAVTFEAIIVHVTIIWFSPAVRGELAAWYLFGAILSLLFAAGLAIFGSYRIETLRRQAAQARRLGQYQLKQKLGAGGMGEVYLAEHLLLRRPCAIKLIRPEHTGDPRNLARFEREVQATATLTNWHTVEIFDYGRATDGTFYYVMEYLPGLNLEQLVARDGPLPAGRVVHLLVQVAEALREAHGIGLIHRDIKPSNIITGRRGGHEDIAKLLDFGLVLAPQTTEDEARLTRQDMVAGTPSYMSPEQSAGQEIVDARSDIYSLGAVAYFLLTGRPPFIGKNNLQILAAHRHEPVQPPRELCSTLPANVEAVVLRCLEKDPAQRFSDADQLIEALRKCQSECSNGMNKA